MLLVSQSEGRGRPAPPPSRYSYTFKVDTKSLPQGVTVKEVTTGGVTRVFLANSSDTPLIINARYSGDRLVAGTKLVSGKVLQYFPNGVPMAGKQHLKGWQSPFGEITQTILRLPKDPDTIYQGRKPGLSKDLPAPESYAIPATYDGEAHDIKVTIHYHLNPEYDKKP